MGSPSPPFAGGAALLPCGAGLCPIAVVLLSPDLNSNGRGKCCLPALRCPLSSMPEQCWPQLLQDIPIQVTLVPHRPHIRISQPRCVAGKSRIHLTPWHLFPKAGKRNFPVSVAFPSFTAAHFLPHCTRSPPAPPQRQQFTSSKSSLASQFPRVSLECCAMCCGRSCAERSDAVK